MNATYVLRTYLGMSQSKLAKKAGITQPDLSEIETKPPYGYLDKYLRLSRVLGVPVDVLLKDDFTAVPMSFFARHPTPEYTPTPISPELLLGRQGEEFIFYRERKRLGQKWPALAKLVLPFYKMKCPSPGYDILSFDDTGKPISLEVKTSVHSGNGFRFTNHELEVAQSMTAKGESYTVVYISGWESPEQRIRDLPFVELEQSYRIDPCYYFCRPIPKRKERPMSGLTYFRLEKGLRQTDLAETLGIPQCDLSQYETGTRRPSVNFYLRVSELLDATVEELIGEYEQDGERGAV